MADKWQKEEADGFWQLEESTDFWILEEQPGAEVQPIFAITLPLVPPRPW